MDKTDHSTALHNDMPLSEHVRHCVENYFAKLDGHEVSDLYQLILCEVERPLLAAALKQADFNQSKAAKTLGLSRSTLRKKLEQYGLN
jgi:Fis family transcriptional regulator, factor for inversion stimulation protein